MCLECVQKTHLSCPCVINRGGFSVLFGGLTVDGRTVEASGRMKQWHQCNTTEKKHIAKFLSLNMSCHFTYLGFSVVILFNVGSLTVACCAIKQL